MIIAVILLGLFALFALECAYWTVLAALFWAPAIVCAVGALYVANAAGAPPLAGCTAAAVTAFAARAAAGRLRDLVLSA